MRGEGLSRKFWMADENAKECRECLSVFTPFRRKHHCRICGQIFCSRCAAHIIKGKRFDFEGMIRVCNFCKRMLEEYDRHERDNRHQHRLGAASQRASKNPNRVQPDKDMISAPLEAQIRSPQAQFAASHLFASASAGPSAFGMGTRPSQSAPFGFADTDSVTATDAHHDVNGTLDSSQAARKKKPDAAPVAPFRKGMDEEEMAPARPDPEEDETASVQLDPAIDVQNSNHGTRSRSASRANGQDATASSPSANPLRLTKRKRQHLEDQRGRHGQISLSLDRDIWLKNRPLRSSPHRTIRVCAWSARRRVLSLDLACAPFAPSPRSIPRRPAH